jgi:hypothetical protein
MPPPVGGGEPEHVEAVVAAFRGVGAGSVKSPELTFVSTHPSPPRTAAVVLDSVGAAAEPS